MSLLSELRPKKGSVKKSKRLGRGRGSGKGGTSSKGHKGQKARSGGSIARGFEGGQMPIQRRLPKFGFTNALFKKTYEIVHLDQLNRFEGEISPSVLEQAGLVKKNSAIKVLLRGKIERGLTVKVHKISESAKRAIEEAGGTVELIPFSDLNKINKKKEQIPGSNN
ncbi:MAG: 50S ribosomal protein L15 [Bdellovibrio sp.]|nr:MAG: 50S ribosomal protein L15 [Bdellovibrio sp.]